MNADMSRFIEQVEDEHGVALDEELKEHYLTKELHMKRAVAGSKIIR